MLKALETHYLTSAHPMSVVLIGWAFLLSQQGSIREDIARLNVERAGGSRATYISKLILYRLIVFEAQNPPRYPAGIPLMQTS
jgi:hypothetical protein